MKKINYNMIFSGVLLFVLTACNNDFMDRFPTDSINDENFWSSENDLKIYCNGLYTFIDGHGITFTNSPLLVNDDQSDNQAPVTFNTVAAGLYIVPTKETKDDGWDWKFIRKCNYFLTRYERADISQEIKDAYAGEVRFFKAWRYFNLVKRYGDVPWLSRDLNTDSEELYAPRDSRILVMDSVLATIDWAIDKLPAKQEAVRGRVNRDFALALKARICLHEGTFRKYHSIDGYERFLQEAVKAAETVINEGNYTIYNTGNPGNDYRSLFNTLDLTDHPEMIYSKTYATGLLGTITSNLVETGASSVTKALVEAYLCQCGKPVSLCTEHYLGDDHIRDELLNRDPRLTQTICYPGKDLQRETLMPAISGSNLGGNVIPTGYQIIKFWVDDREEYARWQFGTLDAPEYRYAEVLLIYAEASAELNQCDQQVLDRTINLLRRRAGMPDMVITELIKDPASDFPELPVLIDEIRRERRVEYAVEGKRYDDLMRWRAGHLMTKEVKGMKFHQEDYPTVVLGTHLDIDENGYILPYHKALPNGRIFEENKHYYFPLPTEELALNRNLVQNSNW